MYLRTNKKLNLIWALIAGFILLILVLRSSAASIGNVESLSWNVTEERVDISCGTVKVRLIYYKADIFRIWVSSSTGTFTDNATKDLVVFSEDPIAPLIDSTSFRSYYLLKTAECALRVYKTPCKFGLFDVNNGSAVFEEALPIDIGSTSKQSLRRQTDEHFYGCGVWNGHYCLTDLNAIIKPMPKFNEDDNPNVAPFYISRLGYGAFRNTWAYGNYDFKSTVVTSHEENRFDCFYFYGTSLKKILRGYTDITGKLFMPPIWGLEMSITGLFSPMTSPTASITECALKWAQNDIPMGSFIPEFRYNSNDFIENLVPELKKFNMWTGIFCQPSIPISIVTRWVREWDVRGFRPDCSGPHGEIGNLKMMQDA